MRRGSTLAARSPPTHLVGTTITSWASSCYASSLNGANWRCEPIFTGQLGVAARLNYIFGRKYLCSATTVSAPATSNSAKNVEEQDSAQQEAKKTNDQVDEGIFDKNTTFQQLGIHPHLLSIIQRHFPYPTKIQALAIPLLLQKKDVVMGAETGSGKTLAYLVPLIHNLLSEKDKQNNNATSPKGKPKAIIVTHNRELARQILNVAKGLTRGSGLVTETAFGLDLIALRSIDIFISTPECVLLNLKRKDAHLELRTIVFDEADLLFSSYSRPIADILRILKEGGITSKFTYLHKNQKPSTKRLGPKYGGQYIVVGATLPNAGTKSIQRAIRHHFNRANWITTPLMHRYVPTVARQFITIQSQEEKNGLLIDLLQRNNQPSGNKRDERVLIFVEKSQSALQVQSLLRLHGKGSVCLHKDTPVEERDAIIKIFTTNQFGEDATPQEKARYQHSILIATDVGARGIDFVEIDHVIEYEFKSNAVSHLHRVGRTARAGKQGRVTTFFEPKQQPFVDAIQAAGEGLLDGVFSRRNSLTRKIKRGRLDLEEIKRTAGNSARKLQKGK